MSGMIKLIKHMLLQSMTLCMSKRKYNVLIVGTGPMAYKYARHVRKHSCLKLVSGYSNDENRSKLWTETFDVPCINNLDDVLSNIDVDIAIIASAPYQHKEHLTLLIEKGVDILCEKPVLNNRKDFDELARKIDASSTIFACVFQKRFNKTNQKAKKFLSSLPLGQILKVEASLISPRKRSYYDSPLKGKVEFSGGGVLITQGIHLLDLIVDLLGSPLEQKSILSNQCYKDIQVEDTAELNILFKNEIEVDLKVSICGDAPFERITFICQNGECSFDSRRWNNGIWRYKQVTPFDVLDKFIYSKRRNMNEYVSFDDVKDTHKIIFDAYQNV